MNIGKLVEWNPWWEEKDIIKELRGYERPKYDLLINSVDIKEITIITGVRRSGKSTLMYQMIDQLLKKGVDPQQILFVNLEDKKLDNNNLDEIYNCYRENMNPEKKGFIFLDEIHRKDGWESWIRKKYDLKTKDKFVISGSCGYLLKKEYSTLLTGRNLTFEVFPLSFHEFLSFKGIEIDYNNLKKGILAKSKEFLILKNFQEYMSFGGFPEVFFKSELYKSKLLKQYFDDVLYKDIIDRYDLNTEKVKDLLLFLTTNFTGLISLRNLRKSLNISYDTIKDYLSYFNEAFILFLTNHFSYSLKKQKSHPSRVYCIDNGLRNAVSFKFSKDEGKLAENLVSIELKRRDSEFYYWRDKKSEVDFVIKNQNNSLNAINVTYTDDINEREINGLIKFKEKFEKAKDLLIITRNLEKMENDIKFIPLWKWLLI